MDDPYDSHRLPAPGQSPLKQPHSNRSRVAYDVDVENPAGAQPFVSGVLHDHSGGIVRFPAAQRMGAEIKSLRRGKQTIEHLATALVQQFAKLPPFEDASELALVVVDDEFAAETGRTVSDVAQARSVNSLIGAVGDPMRRELQRRQMFVASDVLEALIFDAARSGSSDVVVDVLKRIRDARALRAGVLIFPLHSVGVLGAGLSTFVGKRLSFVEDQGGIALTPQTNSFKATVDFLDSVRERLGVTQHLPLPLLEHWHRSRAKWLERNPLLVVRAHQLPGTSLYLNEGLLLTRLQAATGHLALLAALQPTIDSREGVLFSSSNTNNWETRDLHHYLALFDTGGQRRVMSGDCIPIHVRRTRVADLVALDLDLDPRYWSRYSANHDRVRAATAVVYQGYLDRVVGAARDDARSRTHRRLFTALDYFRRSFRSSAQDFNAQVMLSTAFELMLTDGGRGVTNALTDNSRRLLKGKSHVLAMVEAVGATYEARSSLVHAGTPKSADLDMARRAFALCFIELSSRLSRLRPHTSTPVGDLITNR